MQADPYHLKLGHILTFLKCTKPNFYQKEGSAFKELRRTTAGQRYADIFDVAEMYRSIWGSYPSVMYVGDYFADIGYTDPEKAKIMIARMLARGLVEE